MSNVCNTYDDTRDGVALKLSALTHFRRGRGCVSYPTGQWTFRLRKEGGGGGGGGEEEEEGRGGGEEEEEGEERKIASAEVMEFQEWYMYREWEWKYGNQNMEYGKSGLRLSSTT